MVKKNKKRRRRNNFTKKTDRARLSTHFLITVLVVVLVGFIGIYQLGKNIFSPSPTVVAQDETITTQTDFINELAPAAQELQQQYGVLPSIILSQAILESDFGKSRLAAEFHNLFGIKAGDNQEKVHLETQEYYDGKWETVTADFRVFSSNQESLAAHTQLFVNGTTWNPQQYADVLVATNYQEAAAALQTSGYATDPDYTQKIIQVIESYDLQQYDQASTATSIVE